jgi:signal peptidase II
MAAGTLTAFALDQASKLVVVHYLDLATAHVIPVVPPYLVFKMAWNEGANFGLLKGGNRWPLVALSLAVSLTMLLWAPRTRGRVAPFAAGLVIGGALGNALDRILYGAVADFLNMSCCGFENPYAFNVADVSIFLGAALLLISGIHRARVRN